MFGHGFHKQYRIARRYLARPADRLKVDYAYVNAYQMARLGAGILYTPIELPVFFQIILVLIKNIDKP